MVRPQKEGHNDRRPDMEHGHIEHIEPQMEH